MYFFEALILNNSHCIHGRFFYSIGTEYLPYFFPLFTINVSTVKRVKLY